MSQSWPSLWVVFVLMFTPSEIVQVNRLESIINLLARPSLRYVRSTDRELTWPTCSQGNSSSGSLYRVIELVINTFGFHPHRRQYITHYTPTTVLCEKRNFWPHDGGIGPCNYGYDDGNGVSTKSKGTYKISCGSSQGGCASCIAVCLWDLSAERRTL